MKAIDPNAVYTTQEAQELLKISNSTIKRLLKRGILKANKLGGQYRILGREMLRAVSPELEQEAVDIYAKVKRKTKEALKDWPA
jgi:excisionase family DNA binding protein